MTGAERKALDDWRRAQPDIPTRPEAIREAVRRLVAKSLTHNYDEHPQGGPQMTSPKFTDVAFASACLPKNVTNQTVSWSGTHHE